MRFPLIFAPLFLISCAPAPIVETRLVLPDVPAPLLAPVVVPMRPVETLADVGLILTDHVEALAAANDRLSTIACILTRAAAQVDGSPMPDCLPERT